MSVASPPFALEDSFARNLPALCTPWRAAPVREPRLLSFNDARAAAARFQRGQGLFAQGRSLFPPTAVGAVAVAWRLDPLPRRVRGHAAGAWIGGLVVLQIAWLATNTARGYA